MQGVQARNPWLRLVLWCALVYLWVALGLFVFKNALLTMVVYHLALCGGGWMLLRSERAPSFNPKRWELWVFAAAGGCFLTWAAMELVVPVLPASVLPDVTTAPLAALGVNAKTYIPIAIYFGLANPLAEEALWRGRALPLLAGDTSGAAIPNVVQAVLYAGFHVMPIALMFSDLWLASLVVFFAGIVFGYIALATRGLMIPWALHAGANAYLLIWFGRFVVTGHL
ncbi:MAG: hypothetical protein B1H03_02125 [Planctomycetales bacterium 4484_113]|nr:MAG: hypothetical protein B1H03_02125 [Planctomycetales bacterium 4484_113]